VSESFDIQLAQLVRLRPTSSHSLDPTVTVKPSPSTSTMVDLGNTCALVCRIALLILLLYGVVLSCLVVSSCHFISAITHDDETHGVGLKTFEDESGNCLAHNSFVKKNYNGMETFGSVGGIIAPTCGCVAILWFVVECCRGGRCWGGKCAPCVLIVLATVCQGLTFLLFQSDLFCSNKDISRCDLGHAGYRSMQSLLVYFFCLVLCYCGPTPTHNAFKPPEAMTRKIGKKDGNSKGGGDDVVEPASGVYTKEMYERRRREKNVKGRGVSGRSKKEIFDDRKGDGGRGRGGGSTTDGNDDEFNDREDKHNGNRQLAVYNEKGGGKKQRSKSSRRKAEEKFDDYVDTEPDGMDWSAYTPEQRDAFYERKRSKKRERKERERREKETGGGRGQQGRDGKQARRVHPQKTEEYSVVSYDRGGLDDSYHSNNTGDSSDHEMSQYSEGLGEAGEEGRAGVTRTTTTAPAPA